MRAFTMYRRNMDNAPHTAEQKNPPDMPQFEGVVFSDGKVAIRWLTVRGSTACWDSMDDMLAIHGHPEYGSELVWHDVINGESKNGLAHRQGRIHHAYTDAESKS
jgi:hypothetical protein